MFCMLFELFLSPRHALQLHHGEVGTHLVGKGPGGLPATAGDEGVAQLGSNTAQPRTKVTEWPNLLEEELRLLCNTTEQGPV